MVFEIICGNCGASLYSGIELRSAKDILKAYQKRCKKCSINLSTTEFTVEVKNLNA